MQAHGVVSSLKHSQFSLKEGVELKIDLSGDGPRTVQARLPLLHVLTSAASWVAHIDLNLICRIKTVAYIAAVI